MSFTKVNYGELTQKWQEIYNFHKLSAVMVDYGFNCIKLIDDWKGADLLAYQKDNGDCLRIQLKGRITIDKKYIGQSLYMAFPVPDVGWCIVEHDDLMEIIGIHTNWLNSVSWKEKGAYHAKKPKRELIDALSHQILPFQ